MTLKIHLLVEAWEEFVSIAKDLAVLLARVALQLDQLARSVEQKWCVGQESTEVFMVAVDIHIAREPADKCPLLAPHY